MWGTKPSAAWWARADRSSATARRGSPSWAQTTAWKHESHSHWYGYTGALGTV